MNKIYLADKETLDSVKKDTTILLKYLLPKNLKTWQEVQDAVRKGLASEFFEVGDQVMSNYNGGEIIWEVIGIDVDTPTDSKYQHSMTIQTKDCIENGVFDRDNDNRYLNSSVREYLNSEFLSKLDPELSAVLGEVDKKVAKRDVLGGGQDSFSDKVFLLSREEVDLGTEGTTTGGLIYPYYQEKGDAGRIKNLDLSPRVWWLRSPNVSTSHIARYVSNSGRRSSSGVTSGLGLSPACAIV